MAAESSSSSCSKRVQHVVLLLLVLWSVVSLVVIVVWCTSPDLKGASHCRTQLAQRTEQHHADQERWSKDKEALEEKVIEQQQETQRRILKMQQLLVLFNQTKEELQECQQEQVRKGARGAPPAVVESSPLPAGGSCCLDHFLSQ